MLLTFGRIICGPEALGFCFLDLVRLGPFPLLVGIDSYRGAGSFSKRSDRDMVVCARVVLDWNDWYQQWPRGEIMRLALRLDREVTSGARIWPKEKQGCGSTV